MPVDTPLRPEPLAADAVLDAVVLQACPDATGVRITVRDRGPGFPEGFAAHAFERFRRGASTGPGSGLGLAIVAAVAEAHGGRAFVAEDRPGATVVLVLPRVPAGGDGADRRNRIG
jgi:signal transduction histidine kinase